MKQRIRPFEWMGILSVLALTVFGIWKTVYLSADIDESYAVTLGSRLASGDSLFRDMWEVHQTSAVLYAPVIFLYERLTGGAEGLLVFLRFAGCLLQGLLAFYGFCVLCRWTSRGMAFWMSILYFNFTPKQIQSPEFTLFLYWGIFLLGLSFLQFYRSGLRRYMVVAALSLCVCILAYPYAVVLYVVCLFLAAVPLWGKETAGASGKGMEEASYGRRDAALAGCVFTLTCAAAGMLFLAYVLSGISVGELIENIPYVLMDKSHEQSMKQLWSEHIQMLGEMLKLTLPVMLLMQLSSVVWKRISKKRAGSGKSVILAVGCVLQTAAFVRQFHTIHKVNFVIVLPLMWQLLVFLIYVWYFAAGGVPGGGASRNGKLLFAALGIPSVCATLVVLSSSNLPAQYSMGFLLPALEALGIIAVMAAEKLQSGQHEKKVFWGSLGIRLLLLSFGILLLVVRVFLVRFTSSQRKNIFEGYYETNHGPLRGIRLGELDYRQYEAKTALLFTQLSEEDVFLYVGSDLFLYSQLAGSIGTGNTISTPSFGEQLLAYYGKYPDRIPDVMFVDRSYVMDYGQELNREPFKTFVESHYIYDESLKDEPVDVYRRLEK